MLLVLSQTFLIIHFGIITLKNISVFFFNFNLCTPVTHNFLSHMLWETFIYLVTDMGNYFFMLLHVCISEINLVLIIRSKRERAVGRLICILQLIISRISGFSPVIIPICVVELLLSAISSAINSYCINLTFLIAALMGVAFHNHIISLVLIVLLGGP